MQTDDSASVWHLQPNQQGVFPSIKSARLSAAIVGVFVVSATFHVQAAD
jgi:hypothetical protein